MRTNLTTADGWHLDATSYRAAGGCRWVSPPPLGGWCGHPIGHDGPHEDPSDPTSGLHRARVSVLRPASVPLPPPWRPRARPAITEGPVWRHDPRLLRDGRCRFVDVLTGTRCAQALSDDEMADPDTSLVDPPWPDAAPAHVHRAEGGAS